MSIEVKNVSVHYGAVHALQDVSLSLPDGQVHGLIGMNGSGKSTLFNTIAGLIRPATGTAEGAHGGEYRSVSYVPQSEKVDWNFPVSVRDVVLTGRYGHMGLLKRPRPADRAAVAEAL